MSSPKGTSEPELWAIHSGGPEWRCWGPFSSREKAEAFRGEHQDEDTVFPTLGEARVVRCQRVPLPKLPWMFDTIREQIEENLAEPDSTEVWADWEEPLFLVKDAKAAEAALLDMLAKWAAEHAVIRCYVNDR